MIKVEYREYYFVYTHSIDGIVFYVGCGKHVFRRKSKTYKVVRERAYHLAKRSVEWKQYVMGRAIDVSIVSDFLTIGEAHDLEHDLVEKYGRIDIATGSLVNKRGGGSGKGRISDKYHAIKILQEDMNGVLLKTWTTLRSIQEELGYLKTNIVKCCRKKQVSAYGFKWRYENEGLLKDIRPDSSRLGRFNQNRPELMAIGRKRMSDLRNQDWEK